MRNLAWNWRMQGRDNEAEELLSQALGMQRQVLGERHLCIILSIADFASIWHKQGRYEEAEALQTEVLELRRRVLGMRHADTIWSMRKLALIWQDQGLSLIHI